jgi:hypothetical protein
MENSAVRKPDRVISFGAPAGSRTGLWSVMGTPDETADEMLFYTGWKVFWETNCILSWPEFFLCGHPRGCHGFTPPVHALSQQKKKVILRNINRQNTLIQTNPGFL